jgi:RNA-directed DNA polymerase
MAISHSWLFDVRRGMEKSNGTQFVPSARLSAFCALRTQAELAAWLGLSYKSFRYFLFVVPARARYKSFEISKKSGGKRLIEAPILPFRTMQEQLAETLLDAHRPRKCVHGFVRKGQFGLGTDESRSIVTNAANHVRRTWVLNLDLEDFFHSIYFGRVRKLLSGFRFKLPDDVAMAVANICCHEKRLPQGAPTSPVLSNLVCDQLDGELTKLARNHGCRYTRYCDDLTFSSAKKGDFPMALARLGEGSHPVIGDVLSEAILKSKFRINAAKTQLRSSRERQFVTGLTVNRKVNLRRSYIRQVRAMLHAWQIYGEDAAQAEFLTRWDKKERCSAGVAPRFRDVVRGKIEFLGAVRGDRDPIYLKLLRQYQARIPSAHIEVLEMVDTEKCDVFLCHASEDKEDVVDPIAQALDGVKISYFLDSKDIKWGDSVTGLISAALVRARFVVVVLSSRSIQKHWPKSEMNAALAHEVASGETKVLPLLVGKTEEERAQVWKSLGLGADKKFLIWTTAADVVTALQLRLNS